MLQLQSWSQYQHHQHCGMPLTKSRPSLRTGGHKKSKSTVETGQPSSGHRKTKSTLENKIGPALVSPRHQQRPDATLLEEDDEYDSGDNTGENAGDNTGAIPSRRDEAGSGGRFSMPDFRLQGLLSRARKRIKDRRENACSPESPLGPLSPLSPGNSVSQKP